MRRYAVVLSAFLLVAAGCGEHAPKAPPTPRPNYLATVPLLPHALIQDTTGSPDFQHVVFLAPVVMDTAAAYYREALEQRGWRMMADQRDTAHVALYLEREGRPLWVQIQAGGRDCRVTLIAAGAPPKADSDSAAAGPRRP